MVGIGLLEVIVLFGGSILVFGPGFLAAFIAWNKGYRPWFWLLAMGPIGLVWILATPAVVKATTPEQRERWETRTDWTGGILSGFTLLPMFALPLLGVLWFSAVAVRTTPVMIAPAPPPPIVAVPMQAPLIEVIEQPEPPMKSEINSPNLDTKDENEPTESK
jgi:hypothetical protein